LTKRDLAVSVRERLLNQARAQNRPSQELLQYYAMERFLCRLENFANDEGKSAEWTAFIRRSRLTAAPARFTEVVSVVRNFAYPLLSAAASGDVFNRTWQPGGPWTVEGPK
jgi:hypothetical protein